MFTDNSTAEAAYHQGSSKNKSLFELVLGLRWLEMMAGLKIYVIHISGKRMIGHGTDGLSRGNLTEGVMAGQNFLECFPPTWGLFSSNFVSSRGPWIPC
jgi:hypothetical protein